MKKIFLKICVLGMSPNHYVCSLSTKLSLGFQANGAVPTISIDKTDGAQIYVNEKSVKAQIITAKSSEMNMYFTQEDGDLVSKPVPILCALF